MIGSGFGVFLEIGGGNIPIWLLDGLVDDLRYVCVGPRHRSIGNSVCLRPLNSRSFRGSDEVTNGFGLFEPDCKCHVIDRGFVEFVMLGHGAEFGWCEFGHWSLGGWRGGIRLVFVTVRVVWDVVWGLLDVDRRGREERGDVDGRMKRFGTSCGV